VTAAGRGGEREAAGYVATFRAVRGPWPPMLVRLRHLLKLAVRACGLKCVEVREIKGGTNGDGV